MIDLEAHGYGDILFPQEFVNNYDVYKVSVPEYLDTDLEQTSFVVYNREDLYKFVIYGYNQLQQAFDYLDMKNIETITVNGIHIYVFKIDSQFVVEFAYDEYRYCIQSNVPYSELLKVIETIKKGE